MFGGKSCDGNSSEADRCKDKECPGELTFFHHYLKHFEGERGVKAMVLTYIICDVKKVSYILAMGGDGKRGHAIVDERDR